MLRPSQIRKKDFTKSTMGGYKTAEVDVFLEDVASSYEQLYKENSALLKKMHILVENIEQYRNREQESQIYERTVGDAETKAKKIISDARANADKILSDAMAMSDEINAKSLEKSQSIKQEEAKNIAVLQNVREEALNFSRNISALCNGYVSALNSMLKIENAESLISAEPEVTTDADEKKMDFDSILESDGIVFDDVDSFFDAVLSKESGKIKEAFGGFRFEMGCTEDAPENPEEALPVSDFEEPSLPSPEEYSKEELPVLDHTEPEGNSCAVEDDLSDTEDGKDVLNDEEPCEFRFDTADTGEDEIKPKFKISFCDDSEFDSEHGGKEENLDNLFKGFFNKDGNE